MTRLVFLNVPNVIGYVRVALAVWAFAVMAEEPRLFVTLYCVSCVLDVLDGYAARYFQQCSRFGAVLDMVTDRSTTTGLLCYLAVRYPHYLGYLQLLIALDLSSHYMHMYSSLVVHRAQSHKEIGESATWEYKVLGRLLRLYYSNKVVLFMLCAANELVWIALYLLSFGIDGPPVTFFQLQPPLGTTKLLLYVMLPLCAWKHVMNAVQLVVASVELARLDAKTPPKCGTSPEKKRESVSPDERQRLRSSPRRRRKSPS